MASLGKKILTCAFWAALWGGTGFVAYKEWPPADLQQHPQSRQSQAGDNNQNDRTVMYSAGGVVATQAPVP
jgi:hypothetical protein